MQYDLTANCIIIQYSDLKLSNGQKMIDLYNPTILLLKSTSVSDVEIGKAVGHTSRWVAKVRDGEIKDPGTKKMETLYKFLTESAAKIQQAS